MGSVCVWTAAAWSACPWRIGLPVVLDLGVGGISYVESLVLYELWAGERLSLEMLCTHIWRSCRYIGALFRALVGLPGGIRGFVSCDLGANHCRLRHLDGRSVVMALLPGLVSRLGRFIE